jgi:hypothetical protein
MHYDTRIISLPEMQSVASWSYLVTRLEEVFQRLKNGLVVCGQPSPSVLSMKTAFEILVSCM